jgi:hypothetical protein
MKNDDYIIFPIGGLCNRLRVIFSYFQYCKEINKKLIVVWKNDDKCNGFFLNYFKPVNGIKFIQYGLKKNEQAYMGRIDYYGLREHPNNYKNIYNDLTLLDNLQKKVETIKNKLNKYISIHIRRTDLNNMLVKFNLNFTDDTEFIDFINKNKNYNLYIATDNRKTQDKYYKLFKDKIKIIKFIEESDKHRQTTLEQAIIDIFACIYSNKFKGTIGSSFSNLVKTIRKERNIKNS